MNKDDKTKKKKLPIIIKFGNIIKSKIISYGFSLLSIGFLVFILANVISYYLSKYILFILSVI